MWPQLVTNTLTAMAAPMGALHIFFSSIYNNKHIGWGIADLALDVGLRQKLKKKERERRKSRRSALGMFNPLTGNKLSFSFSFSFQKDTRIFH